MCIAKKYEAILNLKCGPRCHMIAWREKYNVQARTYVCTHSYTIQTIDYSCIYYITYVHIIIVFSDPNTMHSKTVLRKSMPVYSAFSNNFTSDYQTSQNTHSLGISTLWLFPVGGVVIMWPAFLRVQ